MIYLITSSDRCEVIKIGYAENPVQRLKQLQVGNPERMYLVASIPGGRGREARLHRRFAQHRIHGEWFRFEADTDLEQFVSDCCHFEAYWPEDKESLSMQEVLSC